LCRQLPVFGRLAYGCRACVCDTHGRDSQAASTFREQRVIRFLANDLRIPLVCLGTEEANQALMTDQQMADRFAEVHATSMKRLSKIELMILRMVLKIALLGLHHCINQISFLSFSGTNPDTQTLPERARRGNAP
jgi:hypothetical protein